MSFSVSHLHCTERSAVQVLCLRGLGIGSSRPDLLLD
jgi:hypothetical protein